MEILTRKNKKIKIETFIFINEKIFLYEIETIYLSHSVNLEFKV